MKKLLILSCALAFCLALAACHTTDSADSSVSSGSPSSAIANESTAHQTEPESSLEESRTSQDTAATSDSTESETTAPAKPANSESTTKPESEKATGVYDSPSDRAGNQACRAVFGTREFLCRGRGRPSGRR